MNERRMSTRILSFLLAIVMIVGLAPATSIAADETVLDAAIFCSDLHGETTNLVSILGQVKNSGVTYSSIGLVGDTCLTVSSVTSAISDALGYTPNVMFSYAKSHDTENGSDIGTNWDYSGEVENVSEHYLVYTIRETDMQNASDADTAAPAFTAWYNGLSDAQKALPIFILSHRPMHDRRDDNAGAATWYSAISAAAESSDIVFFWGHNHTREDSVDQAAYYVAKDGTETMTVYNGSPVVPNFTYMNAGYIDANGQNPARKPVATTVQITEDALIFQDYTTSGPYTDSSYSHNVNVEREFAAEEETTTTEAPTEAVLPAQLAVTGTSEYCTGDAFVEPEITVTYTDGSTKTVTEGYTVEGTYDMTVVGTYTLKYTYTEVVGEQPYTAHADFTFEVKPDVITEFEETGWVSVQVTGANLDTLSVTNAYGDPDLSGTFYDYMAVDVAVTGAGANAALAYSVLVVEDMPVDGLVLYHVAADGTMTVIPYTLATYEDYEYSGYYLEFTTDLQGIFAYGLLNIPEGYVLSRIEVSNVTVTEYFVGDALDVTDVVVTAVYTKEGAEDVTRIIYIKDDYATTDGYTVSGFDMTAAGTQTVTYTYGECTDSYDIHVWGNHFEASNIVVDVTDDYGVNSASVSEVPKTDVAEQIADVIEGDNFVAYDISLNFAEGYADTNGTKTVTLPIPEGVNNPVVYHVGDSGIEKMPTVRNSDGTITFTTTHFSIYVVGDGSEEDEKTLTLGGTNTIKKTVYVLTSSPAAGSSYLIVNGNKAGSYYALANNDGSVAATSVTVKTDDSIGTYIELDDATDELWTVSGTSSYTFQNQSKYLHYDNSLSVSSSSSSWTYSNNRLYSSNRYLRYNSGWTTTSRSNNASSIYFYVLTEITSTTDTTVLYEVSQPDITHVYTYNTDGTADLTQTEALSYELLANGTEASFDGQVWTVAVVSDPDGIIDQTNSTKDALSFTGATGTARLRVYYQLDANGDGDVTDDDDYKVWTTFNVTASNPYYTIQLHKVELEEATGVTADNFANGTYYVYNSTTGFYTKATAYVDGTTYYTNSFTQGEEITEPIALKGVEGGEIFAVWAVVKEHTSANPEGKDMGELGDALTWTVSNENIATIDPATGVITFTGNEYGTFDVTVEYTGADGKTIEDTITISVTESLYVVPGDGTNDFPEYPNQGAVRFDKTATAVGNFSETGIAMVELSMSGVPYTTGSEIDVVLMLDMTGSMDDVSSSTSEPTGYVRIDATIAASKAFISTIVKNEDGSYNGNRVGIYVFNKNGAATLFDFGTVDSDEELEAIYGDLETIKDDHFASGGTPYDDGLGKCYDVLEAARTDGIGNNRQQFTVFMTDGVPTDYEYINGTSHANYSSASTIAGMLTSASNYATRDTDYKYEYYSTEMKKAGVTVYTVGVGLFNENNAWDGTATQCGNLASALLNDISGPANEAEQPDAVGTATLSKKDKYFFSVDDADAGTEMTRVFSNIASEIKQAATNVTVEDKIGNNYALNFSFPSGLAADGTATDGLQEFYIEILSCALDADHNRPVDADGNEIVTSLEKFTFNADGTFKSHTIGTSTCSDCSHVTVKDGKITAINGTYFTYVSDANGEILTWKADKLDQTELIMRYFVHLDDSSGTDVQDQIDAGTYYTNEYATLTYTNFNGKEVQQEFPVPQMTWKGAQVTFLFYLVNENGEPVNRAGRVVPFAEAVYVTVPVTEAVTWYTNEGTEKLEAKQLANELVPDVYQLYDLNAYFEILVYQTEGVDTDDVNYNHFIIEGSDQATLNAAHLGRTVTNASLNTTKVFNTKADITKYSAYGAYSETSRTYTSTKSGTAYTPTITSGLDYANTTVAFAVIWKPELVPDTVVVDFGLDVIIDVTFNDALNTTAVGVRTDKPKDSTGTDVVMNTGRYDATKATTAPVYITVDGKQIQIGTASTIEGNQAAVQFSFYKENAMQFTTPAVFYYESDLKFYDNGNLVTTSMYSSVTVIPATTVYYEDKFVTFTDSGNPEIVTDSEGKVTAQYGVWSQVGTTSNKTQDVDRPGVEEAMSDAYDANNPYGYDSAYEKMSTWSMGSAMKVSVKQGISGMASFTFYGTGFDIVSMTDKTTGQIIVQVKDASGNVVKSLTVDTYYGYAYNADTEEWTPVTSADPNALYQVPVIKVEGLPYGKYSVQVVASYIPFADADQDGSYDFYMDAVRIYEPTGSDTNPEGAYTEDGEGYPIYIEVRDQVIDSNLLGSDLTVETIPNQTITVNGAAFIDGIGTTASISDYTSFGPNNELYLAPGQGIAFTVNSAAFNKDIVDVQLAMKTVGGNGKVEIFNIGVSGSASNATGISSSTYTKRNLMAQELNSATDMYYSIKDLANGVIVIYNPADSGTVISITNLKFTFDAAAEQVAGQNVLTISNTEAADALRSASGYTVTSDGMGGTTQGNNQGTDTSVQPNLADNCLALAENIRNKVRDALGRMFH